MKIVKLALVVLLTVLPLASRAQQAGSDPAAAPAAGDPAAQPHRDKTFYEVIKAGGVMMIPLLTVVGDVVGILGGMLVGYSELGIPIETYYAKTLQWVTLRYFIESIIKSAIFAFIITIVGCWRGFETGADAVEVGKSTTSAVVISILLIIISDTILGKFFNTLFFG